MQHFCTKDFRPTHRKTHWFFNDFGLRALKIAPPFLQKLNMNFCKICTWHFAFFEHAIPTNLSEGPLVL
jgi:hypothetical protein